MKRGVVRQGGWSTGLAALLSVCLTAAAQPHTPPGEAPVQIFSEVNRPVVAAGTSFLFDVQVYALPASDEAARRVTGAFAAARFEAEGDGLSLLREEEMTVRAPDGEGPLVLERRFVIRALRSGALVVPPLRFSLGERAYATPAHPVTAYEIDPDFLKMGASILPVVAEYSDASKQQYARIGSAFVVGLDAVVTSLHVVVDARRVWLTLPDGRRLSTRKAWVLDPVHDVAVLHVDPRAIARAGLTPLSLAPVAGAVASPEETDEMVAFTNGWPGGVQRSTAGVRYPGMTLQPGASIWITANPVRPGDSGGPLLDRHARVLGVVTSGAVGAGGHTAAREELCIALDPRPALGRKQAMRRPRALRALMREAAFAAHPYVQAIRLTTMLTAGRRRIPGLADALARLNAVPDEAPDQAQFHFLRGIIYQLLGTRADAADAYRASLKAFDGHFLSAYMLGVHHLHRREYAAAARFFRHAQQYEPYRHLAAYGLARALMGRLRYAEALPHLHRIVTHDPGYAPALYDLALCALALEDHTRVRHLLARLEDVSPASARRLRRVLREPVLHPRVLRELPRAALALPVR